MKKKIGKRVIVLNDFFGGYSIGILRDIIDYENWFGTKMKIYCVDIIKNIGVPKWQKKSDYLECRAKDIAIFEG